MITLLDALGGGLSEAQLQLWHKLGNACNKCDYISLELECLMRKFKYYTFQQLDERKYADLEKRISQLSVTQRACNQCKSSMLLVRGILANEAPLPEHFSLSTIQNAVDTYPIFDVQAYGGEVLISLAMNQKDYDEAIKRINQVYKNIIERFPRETDLLVKLSFQKLLCYIALKDYRAGKRAWEELFSLHNKTSSKRARYQTVEAGILLLLRCESVQEVGIFLTTFTALGGISGLSEHAKGRWRAIFATLRVLNLQDSTSATEIEGYLNKLNRRHKSFKAHPEDVLTVAIMDTCYLIISGNLKKASKNISRLAPFTPKRLSTSAPLYRRTLFLQLLQKSASVNFHPAAVQRKTASLQAKLKKTKISISEEALSNELLPFHSLWSMIINARL
jgi:tetratricopeptide (TPR) repeat protein